MIHIRDATGADALAIRNVFLSTYGADYPDPHYYDVLTLTRMIYSDDALVLVAEDTASGEVVGTGSVLLDFGAHADLVGEFGRLAVHPDARDRRIGRRLLEERIRRVQGRLHVGVMEARVAHPFTLKIAEAQEFAAVGFLPRKMLLGRREDLALMARHFGEGLALRKNNCSGAVADAVAGSRGGWDWARASEAEERAQSRLLLDLYGDPGQPFTTLDPSWLAWEGGLIPRLAQAIYEERAFDQLPVLADALEDAGCHAVSAGDRASQAILQHLRGPGPHARGCHILDAILGRH
jgi:GNAT superfamily N-acetyltransferase